LSIHEIVPLEVFLFPVFPTKKIKKKEKEKRKKKESNE